VKVMLLTEASNAGVGRHVIDLAMGLSARGIAVHVAYSPVRADAAFRKFVAGAPGAGIGLSAIPMRRSPHPSDVRSVLVVDRELSRYGPFDILHAHSSKAGGVLRLAPRARTGSIVYTPNAMLNMNPLLPGIARVAVSLAERSLQRRAARIVAVSEHERTHFESVGILPTRIRVVPMGSVVPEASSARDARNQMGIGDGEICIGWVGRLANQKAPEVAIAALRGMIEQRARLVIVGGGPQRPELETIVARLGLEERVVFLGERAAAPLMTGFDVFLSTSRYESFGLVLVEAAANGTPLVTTPVGIAPELIAAGAGVLVPIGHVDSTARALDRVLADPTARSVMSSRARRAARRLSVDEMVEGNLEVYREISVA
jgi:glycosyltransferase involved in cell wall biosynthesis